MIPIKRLTATPPKRQAPSRTAVRPPFAAAMPPTPPEPETEPEFAEVDPTGRYGRVMPPPTTFVSLPPPCLCSIPPPMSDPAARHRADAFRPLAVHGGSWQGRLQDGVSFHFHSTGLRRLIPIWSPSGGSFDLELSIKDPSFTRSMR